MTAPGRDTTPAQVTATGVLAASELVRGDVIAQRFRIDSMLGIGGMGVVYRAQDLQLDVPVALKLLRPEVAARPDAFSRFRQELLLARQVSSPHVVRIHDLVQHGSLWLISMDFVPGASLEKRLDLDGPMAPERALKLIRQVALGLAAAHDRGVVHRDLKPANILVTDADEAYISDFGVARSAAMTGVTGTGVVVGTPEYLSPEQARAETVDGRSDLYTLGLILYELIVGQLPFHHSTAAESLAQRIVRAPPPLRRAKADVPAWLDALCSRLLTLKPAHRMPNARAVIEAIDRRRVPPAPGRWPRRIGAALAALALVGGGVWLWQRAPTASATVEVPTLDLLMLPVRVPSDADADTRGYAAGLSRWLWASLAASPMRSADPERMEVLLRQRGFDPDAAARNHAALRDSLPSQRLLTPELVRVADGWHLRLVEPGIDPAKTRELALSEAATAGWDGSALGLEGPAPRTWPGRAALTAFGLALDLAPNASLDLTQAYAESLRLAPTDASLWRAALSLAERGATPNALAALSERALASLRDVDTQQAAVARAHASLVLGDAEGAARELALTRNGAPSDLPMQRLWARVQAELEGPEAAIAPLLEVVRQDPQDQRAWFLLGRFSLLAGDARRAVDEYLVRALVIALRIGDERATAEARNALGLGYERLGQTQAAIEHFAAAADARERLGDALGAANSLRNLAAAEAVRGDFTAAERALDRATGLLKDIDAPLAQANLHNDRGLLAEERGEFRAALTAYRDALALRQAADDAAGVAESQFNVGFSYYQIGEFDNALVYWRQSEAGYADRQDDAGQLRAKQSLALIDRARGAWNEARATLAATAQSAEATQMTEELAVSLTYLGELDRLQGRLGPALENAARSATLFQQREDQRGSTEAALARVAVWLDAGAWENASVALAAIDLTAGGNAEQRAQHALLRARLELGRKDFDAAAAALTEALGAATAAHSQAVTIEVELVAAHLASQRGDAAGAASALARAQASLKNYAPVALSLLAVETALSLGDRHAYDTALALLRRVPDYGREHAIHHAAARAFHTAGDRSEALAATERWKKSRDLVRTPLLPELRTAFDALPEAHDPSPPAA